MKRMESDRVLAALFHAQHRLQMDDLPFWLGLAAHQGGPILELGCGTGRVLVPLAEAGFAVLGIDRSPAMLSVLSTRLPAKIRPRVSLIQADLAAFRLALHAPLILMPCNTLSTLSPTERQAAFNRIQQHLQGDGRFAAGVANPGRLVSLPEFGEPDLEEIVTHPVSGNPVQVSSTWQRTRRAFTVTWIYDHLLPDGNVVRSSTTSRHLLTGLDRYQAELQANGFKLEAVYGDYDRRRYAADSPFLIMVARKK